MDYKNIKLIVTDMDGTLLNSKSELPVNFYSVYEKLKEKKIILAIASGRQFENLRKKLHPIANELFYIAENGSYLVENNTTLHVDALNWNAVKEFITIARKIPNVFPILCGKKKAYIENTDPTFMGIFQEYMTSFEVVDDLLKVTSDDILKVSICDFTNSATNSYPFFKAFESNFQIKISGTLWLDISSVTAHKGNALAVLQKYLNISTNETMAFGDYNNDIEMMTQAYFSYAMANATPQVKAAARFITSSNDDNGVLNIIETLLKNQSN